MNKVYLYSHADDVEDIYNWIEKIISDRGDENGDRLDTISSLSIVPAKWEAYMPAIGCNNMYTGYDCIITGTLVGRG